MTTVPPRPALAAALADLYRRQLALAPNDHYLAAHARPAALDTHVRTFEWYSRYLPETGTVLDWGCNHAPDSCLLRARFGSRFRLHACDFRSPGHFGLFHEFAGLTYTRLEHLVTLPYPDHAFDVVIGSGTLEHTAMDYESLKQLHRVLRPAGTLVLSYLPNRWSSNEWFRRVVRRADYHRRLYGLAEVQDLLKRSGFVPLRAAYHTFLWERCLNAVGVRRWERPLAGLLSCLLPIHLFCGTLCVAARKVRSM